MNDPGRRALERRTSRKADRRKPSRKDASPASGRSNDLPVFDERQRREFAASSRPMRIFDRETLRYLAVNDASIAFYGYSREEFLRLTINDVRHPDELGQQLANIERPEGYLTHFGPQRQVKKSGKVAAVEIITNDILFNGRRARVCLTIDVTERMRALELLRQREQEFETLAENLPDPVARFDRQGRYVYVNSAVERLTGLTREAMLGRTQGELGMPGEVAALFEHSLADTVRTGETHMLDFVFPQPSGERLMETYHVPERNAAGEVATVLCVARDITERKRAESALRESNEFLRSVIESSRDCIKVLDLHGRLLMMSTGGQSLLEIADIRPYLHTSWIDFWKGPDHEAALSAIRAASGGGTGHFEGYFPTVGGAAKWWDVVITPICNAQGKPERLLAISRDITDSRRAEAALRESEERFRQIAENIREVFWINTPAGDNLLYVSPAYEEIWGRSCESLYRNPRGWMEAMHPDDLPLVQANPEKEARGERTDIEYRIIRPDGTLRWIRDRSYPMRRGDGTLLVCGIAEDVTEQKRAEEERLTHAIHQRDALVREVHHRIKNHLQGIAGLLRNQAVENPAAGETIEAAVAQLQSVAVVYGLQSELAESGVPLARVLEAICSSAEGLSPARIERGFDARAGEVRLAETEAVPVAVALNELVFNAIEHGSGSGGNGPVEVAFVERKDGADIRIVNRGKLPPRFDYAHGRGTGTGLELVRTLLGPAGVKLKFGARDGKVEVTLSLRQPLVIASKAAAGARGGRT